MGKKNKWPYLFCLPFIAAYALFSLYPMLYSLQLSFFDWNGIGTKTFVGLQNYITLFTKDPLFWKALKKHSDPRWLSLTPSHCISGTGSGLSTV